MHKENNNTPHGAMGKGELARLYLPNISERSATNCLTKWINNHPVLRSELEKTGLKRKQKMLTPLQVSLIIQYLGEP